MKPKEELAEVYLYLQKYCIYDFDYRVLGEKVLMRA